VRTRDVHRLITRVLSGTLLVLLPAGVFAQDEAFKKGVDAYKDKKYAEAVTFLQQAIKEDSKEAPRRVRVGGFLGVGSEPYLPYFFLGMSLMRQNNRGAAAAVLEESLKQGAISADRGRLQEVRDALQECEKSGVLVGEQYETRLRAARVANEQLSQNAREVADLGSKHPSEWALVTQRYDRVRANATAASARLEAGQRSRLAADLLSSKMLADQTGVELTEIRAELQKAIGRSGEAESKLKTIEAQIADAEASDKKIESRLAIPAIRAVIPSDVTRGREDARALVTSAKNAVDAARKTTGQVDVGEPERLARNARSKMKGIEDLVEDLTRKEFESSVMKAAESIASADATAAAVTERIRATASLTPEARAVLEGERDAVTKTIADARTRLEGGRRSRKFEMVSQLAATARAAQLQLQGVLDKLLALEQSAIPTSLKTAARHLFAGEYEQTLNVLTDAAVNAIAEVRWRIHAHLFRAAALFALYVRSSETSDELRGQARREVVACRSIDAAFEPDAATFSPRFLEFFRAPARP
jgi:hypothetical protein